MTDASSEASLLLAIGFFWIDCGVHRALADRFGQLAGVALNLGEDSIRLNVEAHLIARDIDQLPRKPGNAGHEVFDVLSTDSLKFRGLSEGEALPDGREARR